MQKPIDNQLALLKCIADETRFKILLMLKDGERCVCEIFRELGKEQSLISHHLRIARRCGLVEGVRQGKWIRYRLADPSIAELLTKIEKVSRKLHEKTRRK
ncbi:MAG: metalloregulator ArsR/SmtB family transcription factor [Candidatus Hadarchaeales archaeon]